MTACIGQSHQGSSQFPKPHTMAVLFSTPCLMRNIHKYTKKTGSVPEARSRKPENTLLAKRGRSLNHPFPSSCRSLEKPLTVESLIITLLRQRQSWHFSCGLSNSINQHNALIQESSEVPPVIMPS